MLELHPQFITDTVGSEMVILPRIEFDSMIEELEEIDDIQLLHEALSEDNGERISLHEYVKMRNERK
jgi:hypothetical protein